MGCNGSDQMGRVTTSLLFLCIVQKVYHPFICGNGTNINGCKGMCGKLKFGRYIVRSSCSYKMYILNPKHIGKFCPQTIFSLVPKTVISHHHHHQQQLSTTRKVPVATSPEIIPLAFPEICSRVRPGHHKRQERSFRKAQLIFVQNIYL